jgi:crotonobetainyl-CoA:carnitine CoA-transferase CaiB-like acyl-CoA transferase
MAQPLEGVRVLDLTRLLPGGMLTMMLADLGADVLKIEDPNGGDYVRWMPPLVDGLSAYFRINNRNKRSLILDLKHSQGAVVLHRLLAGADVLVESFRPDVMTRLGCGADSLRAAYPRLIYCALSGWGADGPYARRGGHDLSYVSLAGLTGAMETPQPPGGQVADIAGAYMALNGILAALFRRERSGEGAFVDVSLFESALPFVQYSWMESLLTAVSGGAGLLTGGQACYRIYRTADGGGMALGALEPKFWEAFCQAVSCPDLIPDYLAPEKQKPLRAELEALFLTRTTAGWVALLDGVDCCCVPVQSPAALADDPQVQARGMAGVGADGATWLRTPLHMTGLDFQPGAVPGYGEHTRAALGEAGYAPEEIEVLLAAGVVRQSL